jgi:hypothetical protein
LRSLRKYLNNDDEEDTELKDKETPKNSSKGSANSKDILKDTLNLEKSDSKNTPGP